MDYTGPILDSEYSTNFDELRKKMMVMSYYKYGPVSANYKTEKTIQAIASLKRRLEMYENTGNTEFLADIANFAMIEFMYPQHPKAFYKPTDGIKDAIVGFGINEVNNWEGK